MKSQPLHELAFGSSIALTERSVTNLQDRMAAAQGWETRYEAVGDASLFATRTASLQLNGLRLTAVAHSPFQSKVVAKKFSTLVVPLAGEASVSQINGRSISMAPGESAAFAPAGERIGRGGYRSVLMVDIDPVRLQATWQTMSGAETPRRRMIDIDTPQELSLRSLGRALPHLCATVDQFCKAPQALLDLGVDENFYRLTVMLMQASQAEVAREINQPEPLTRRRVDSACQYATAHLAHTITLTDLERAANLSSRALQYAFLKRFDCSPMEWVRNQRFDKVRQYLASADPDTTVTSAALAFGFFSLSKFASGYAKRFGELPSVTLSNSRRR
jgi:AraC-like DNA-binding protein